MNEATRRGFLGAMAAAGGAAVGLSGESEASADSLRWTRGRRLNCVPTQRSSTIEADDPRYVELTTRGYNGLFVAQPESVRLVHSTEQIVQAVNEAVRSRKKIVVRSGGHCFENFVDDQTAKIIVDVSEMNDIYYDPRHRAFAVEAGATLGQVYRTLYLGWGVTIPAGGCPSVGVGGHIAGGGYGPLSRKHGLGVDHLYGVEVVVVDRRPRARVVVATSDPRDPNRDLWWAHTGGGGGNFGIVTRYLMRSPDATGNDPTTLLPKPPAQLFVASVSWNWEDLDEAAFSKLADNYGRWQEEHDADPTYESMDSSLTMFHRSSGSGIELFAGMDGTLEGIDGLLWLYIQAINEGVGVEPTFNLFNAGPWMRIALSYDSGAGANDFRFKSKAAYMRKRWSPEQLKVVYNFLTEGEDNYGSAVYLMSYGGKINTVDPAATAMAHRDSRLIGLFDVGWWDPAEDDKWLATIRELYRDVYSATGGVPVPDDANDGAYINYPDTDLADPAWNTSGVPWHKLYYKDNYVPLQQVKAKWDPRDVFNHALSVRLPGADDALPPQTRSDSGRSDAGGSDAERQVGPVPKKYPRAVPPRHVYSLRTLDLQD